MTLPSSGPITSNQVKAEILEDTFDMPDSYAMQELTGKTPIVISPSTATWVGMTLPNDFWGKTYWRYGSFWPSGGYGYANTYVTWDNHVYGPPALAFNIGWTDYTGADPSTRIQQPHPEWVDTPGTSNPGQNGYYAKGVISIYGMYPNNQYAITLVGGNYGPHQSETSSPANGYLRIGYADSNGSASWFFNVPNDNFWYPGTVGYHIQRYQLWERDPFNNWVTHGRYVDLTRGANEGYDYLGSVTQF